MLVKIETRIIIDVPDKEEAEQACSAIEGILDRVAFDLKGISVLEAVVPHYGEISQEDAKELGLIE